MTNYFENFPIINYGGRRIRDISRRDRFVERLQSDPYVSLPYTIKDGDKPEDIAYYYYGSTDYTWLVLLANNIVDPYHDWPLSEDNFEKYLINKYAGLSNRKGYDVIDWLRDPNINDNIYYYYKEV
jgi:hypothetical protein